MLVFVGSHSFAITCVLVMLLVCCITICVCIVVTSICPVISLFSILSCTLPDSSPRTSPYLVLSFHWGDVLLPRNRPVVADVNSPWSHMPYWSSRSHPRTSWTTITWSSVSTPILAVAMCGRCGLVIISFVIGCGFMMFAIIGIAGIAAAIGWCCGGCCAVIIVILLPMLSVIIGPASCLCPSVAVSTAISSSSAQSHSPWSASSTSPNSMPCIS